MYEAIETVTPPEGYHLLYTFRYPKTFGYLTVLLYLLAYLTFYLIWKFVRHSFFPGMEGPMVFWIVALPLPIVDLLRALIQRSMSHLLGYRVSFNIIHITIQPETYTADPEQWQKRIHALLIAIAPLSIFMLLWIPLVVGVQAPVGDAFAFFLFVSVARTVGDLYFAWRVLWMPRNVLLYTVNIKEKIVFELIG